MSVSAYEKPTKQWKDFINLTKSDMRKLLLLFLMCYCMTSAYSQKTRYFCEIKSMEKQLSNGLDIVFDFGENTIYSLVGRLSKKQRIVDENGEEIEFFSIVDAGNYLSSKGWQFQQAYSSFYRSNCIEHWIFYKDANSPEEAAYGIMTKDMYKQRKKK